MSLWLYISVFLYYFFLLYRHSFVTNKRMCIFATVNVTLFFAITAVNGGRLFALTYMKLSDTEPAFQEIHISSFMESTLVITIVG